MKCVVVYKRHVFFFFQAEDGIRDRSPSRGLGDVYKRQDIVNMIDTKSVSVDAELNVNDNSYMPSINGGGISFSFDKDVDKKLAQSKVSALYKNTALMAVSYTHLRAHETDSHLVCRLLLEKNYSWR